MFFPFETLSTSKVWCLPSIENMKAHVGVSCWFIPIRIHIPQRILFAFDGGKNEKSFVNIAFTKCNHLIGVINTHHRSKTTSTSKIEQMFPFVGIKSNNDEPMENWNKFWFYFGWMLTTNRMVEWNEQLTTILDMGYRPFLIYLQKKNLFSRIYKFVGWRILKIRTTNINEKFTELNYCIIIFINKRTTRGNWMCVCETKQGF